MFGEDNFLMDLVTGFIAALFLVGGALYLYPMAKYHWRRRRRGKRKRSVRA